MTGQPGPAQHSPRRRGIAAPASRFRLIAAGVAVGAFSVAAAVLATGSAALGSAAPAPTGTAATQPPVPIHRVSLHTAYERALPLAHHGPIEDKTHPVPSKGTQPLKPAAKAGAACAEPNCNLSYGGGPVQHNPKVYLLLWGPAWSPTGADSQYLNSFYSGLGASGDNWSTITSQYTDSTGHPTFSGSVFQGVYQDTTTPTGTGPSGSIDPNDLNAEADAFVKSQNLSNLGDVQVVIASQSGACFDDGWGGQPATCAYQPGTGGYCGWHTNSSAGETFTNLPYTLDAKNGCGENFINRGSAGTYDGFSMIAGHEYAESITDPQPTSGWIDNNDTVSGGENGDKCLWGGANWGGSDPKGDVVLSTGTFAMQSLWSNAAGRCVMPQGTTTGAVKGYGGKCLDNYHSSTANGGKIDLFSCNGSRAQLWTFQPQAGQYVGHLVNATSGKCLNDAGYGGPGAKVIQWACGNSSNELWRYWPAYHEYSLYSGSSTVCLNDPGYSQVDGVQQIVWSCPDTANEQYSFPS